MRALCSLGAFFLIVSSALAMGGCVVDDDNAPPAAERGQEARFARPDSCEGVRCKEGSRCLLFNGKASCVSEVTEDLCPGLGTRNPRTGECECHARPVCLEGTSFNEDPAVCACSPRRPECQTDDDCVLFSDYCGFCTCRALSLNEPGPSCAGVMVQCLVDPCGNKVARCSEGSCKVSPVPAGEPCGPAFCAPDMVCCNDSCGICTPPGGVCTKQLCLPD